MKVLNADKFRASLSIEIGGETYVLYARTVREYAESKAEGYQFPVMMDEVAAFLEQRMQMPTGTLAQADEKLLNALGRFYFQGKYPEDAEDPKDTASEKK